MILLPVSEASKKSGLSEATIRNYINENRLTKYTDENGLYLLDKREILTRIPIVCGVYNHKGGAGKTTSALSIIDYYEQQKLKVLAIDFDIQGNLSKAMFDFDKYKKAPKLFSYFVKNTALNKLCVSYSDHVDVLLADVEMEILESHDVNYFDEKVHDFKTLFKKYNLIIIDCPPNRKGFTKLALLLANIIFVPVIPAPFDYDAFYTAITFMMTMSKWTSFDYKVFFSRVEGAKRNIQLAYMDQIINDVGKDKVFKNYMPNFNGLSERGQQYENIFRMFPPEKNKATEKIKLLMNELDKYIYEER